jgi:predicted nucleic acid-binding protein
VSGIRTPGGTCDQILESFDRSDFVLILDERILSEYAGVLRRSGLGIDRTGSERFLSRAELLAEFVVAPALALASPDPDDLPFLEVAIAGEAHALVTGNPRHFPPALVPILSPREFVDRFLT